MLTNHLHTIQPSTARPWKTLLILCYATAMLTAPLIETCHADNTTCLFLGNAGCRLTSNAAAQVVTDAENAAYIANDLWANLAMAACQQNQGCVNNVFAQATANANLIYHTAEAALSPINQAYLNCLKIVESVCGGGSGA